MAKTHILLVGVYLDTDPFIISGLLIDTDSSVGDGFLSNTGVE